MPSAAQLEGQRFGMLTVITRSGSRVYSSGKEHRALWHCLCDCGKALITTTDMLRKGEAKSCGCQRFKGLHLKLYKNNAKRRSNADVGFITLYNSYKNNKRNKDFNLTQDAFRKLTSSNCAYCGEQPRQQCRPFKLSLAVYVYNGLDRVNTNKGYVIDNVVPSCKYCNYAKNSLSKEDFFKLIKKIYEFNQLENVNDNYMEFAKAT